jgi:phosphoglycerate dehydrogenase-like enzyme
MPLNWSIRDIDIAGDNPSSRAAKVVLIYDPSADQIAKALGHQAGCTFRIATTHADAVRLAPGSHAIFAISPLVTPDLVAAASELEWVQALTSGTDTFSGLPLDDICVTTMKGIHGPQMAELAVMMMLALRRKLPLMIERQHCGEWVREPQPICQDAKIVIVGSGTIAQEAARLMKALGMRVVGISRQPRPIPHFDSVEPVRALPDQLRDAAVALLLCPLNDETRNLFDAEMLSALPESAILLNLARGEIVDEQALVEMLQAGKLAGAGLDAFAVEPLPVESPLRILHNVIITPHIGGLSDCYVKQMTAILTHNLAKYLGGEAHLMINKISV